MNDEVSFATLAAQLQGLRDLMESKMDGFSKRLDNLTSAVEKLAADAVSDKTFGDLKECVKGLERDHVTRKEHDELEVRFGKLRARLEKVERVTWVVTGFFGLFGVPTILWAMYRALEAIFGG